MNHYSSSMQELGVETTQDTGTRGVLSARARNFDGLSHASVRQHLHPLHKLDSSVVERVRRAVRTGSNPDAGKKSGLSVSEQPASILS